MLTPVVFLPQHRHLIRQFLGGRKCLTVYRLLVLVSNLSHNLLLVKHVHVRQMKGTGRSERARIHFRNKPPLADKY